MKRILLFLSLLAVLPSCSFNLKTFLQHKNPGTIVLLNGTSSAGKTAIMKELQKIYGDSYVVINGDLFLENYLKEHSFPEQEAEADAWIRQFFSTMILHAKQLSLDGKNVIFDVVQFDDHYDAYCAILDCESAIKILVYCPPDILVDRVEARNRSGDPKEKRSLNQAFGQFQGIYKLQELPDEMIVDRIAASRINYGLQVAQQEALEAMKKADVQDAEKSNAEFVKRFVDQFKLATLAEIVLVPKHKWDLVVNTGIHSPAEIAQEIGQYLKSKVVIF